MKFFKLLSLLCFVLLFQNNSIGQCTSIEQLLSDNATMVDASKIIGQSFKACKNGTIDKIAVKVDFMGAIPISSVLTIAKAANTSSNVIHTQNIMINNMGELEIVLTTPIALVSGDTYSFSLGGAGDALDISFSSTLGDVYPDGNLFINTISTTTFDLFFKISYTVPEPVPTLSQWGLMIFGLLVLNLGVFGIRKKELQIS